MSLESISCIVCGKALRNLDEGGHHPNDGLAFETHGHYGSRVFDPMDGTMLAISVCDECVVKAAGRGDVYRAPPLRRTKPAYSKWKGPT